jgi:hypothetical protein
VWLTRPFASRLDVVLVSFPVRLKIVYLLTCPVLSLAVLVLRGDRTKDTELLVLRQENDLQG